MLNLDNIVSNKNTSSSKDNNWPFRMLIIGPAGPLKLQTLWKTSPLSTKARQIKEDDIRIQEYVCNKSNENMD